MSMNDADTAALGSDEHLKKTKTRKSAARRVK